MRNCTRFDLVQATSAKHRTLTAGGRAPRVSDPLQRRCRLRAAARTQTPAARQPSTTAANAARWKNTLPWAAGLDASTTANAILSGPARRQTEGRDSAVGHEPG